MFISLLQHVFVDNYCKFLKFSVPKDMYVLYNLHVAVCDFIHIHLSKTKKVVYADLLHMAS
jgi:hypothetical protein